MIGGTAQIRSTDLAARRQRPACRTAFRWPRAACGIRRSVACAVDVLEPRWCRPICFAGRLRARRPVGRRARRGVGEIDAGLATAPHSRRRRFVALSSSTSGCRWASPCRTYSSVEPRRGTSKPAQARRSRSAVWLTALRHVERAAAEPDHCRQAEQQEIGRHAARQAKLKERCRHSDSIPRSNRDSGAVVRTAKRLWWPATLRYRSRIRWD